MAVNGKKYSLECAPTLLLQVCMEGNVDLAKELLSLPSTDLVACDEDRNTALHLAAEQGHLAVVQELVGRYNTLLAGKNTIGRTPLHLASMRGHSAVVEALAQIFPGDLEARDEYGDTPLHLAALFGHIETVDLLCQHFHCDPEVKGLRGRTVLHHACSGGHLSIVDKLIVEYKCSPSATDADKNTPLHCAVFYGHTDIVFKVVNVHGCFLTLKGFGGSTLLHHACSGGHLSLARKLISDYGFDPMEKDDTGKTSLHWAAGVGDPLAPIGNFHVTANASHVNTVTMLITEYECLVDCVDTDGNTALNLAALNGHTEVVGILIAHFGCSASVKGQYGQTPLHRACDSGHLDVVEKLVSEYGCDVNARDNDGCTPLHAAALAGRKEVVRELISKYRCPVDCMDSDGCTPLHWAAIRGHVGVVRMLSEFGADVAGKISNGDTTLNLATLYGHAEVVSVLISEFKCSPGVKGQYDQTPFHDACYGGHLDVVEKLVIEYGCDVIARDNGGLTSLHVAALAGREKVVRELITKYNCPVDSVDSNGCTPLHWAAYHGHVGVVRMLLSEFGADAAVPINGGNTALNLAAFNGHGEVVDVLISECSCSPNVKGFFGQTPLHQACNNGHMDVAEKLISEYGCDVNARDNDGLTPLHVAAWSGRKEVVRELITKYNYPVDCVDSLGCTPLHRAAWMGHVAIVRMLCSQLKANLAVRDKRGNTTLNLAALNGHAGVVHVLIKEFDCSPSVKGFSGQTPLHDACGGGHLNVVDKLVSEYGCDVNARDSKGLTPLHVAALAGREEVVRKLITKCKCPVDLVYSDGFTPLHMAASKGHVGIVKMLSSEFGVDVTARISNGNTALNIAALNGHAEVVDVLISEFGCHPNVKGENDQTPLHQACKYCCLDVVKKLVSEKDCDVNARDKNGRTPLYYAISNPHSSIVAELVRHNSDLTHVDPKHKKLLETAKKHSKYAGTKVFIVGSPEVGKSTLLKALQSETFFPQNVKQVPAHTAGIVPVFHESNSCGRVMFYDFAGDEEYYSSHAAILERIMGGFSNLFLLVFDLRKISVATQANSIYYWLTFLSYAQQKSSRLQVLLIGSHADVLQKEGRDAEQILNQIFTDISKSFYAEFPETSVHMFGYVALNCCLTKSQGLHKIKAQLKQVQLLSLSDAQQLTAGASILLGTLERNFQGKVACQVKEVIEHIKSHELYLPPEAEQLCSYLKELHAYGVVLLLECRFPQEDEWIVLDLPLFLSTVHKQLFSLFFDSLHQYEDSLSNLGIVPSARLQTMIPEFPLSLLKGCLTVLQYCQEICDHQIISKVLEISTGETISDESVLFFPALLQTSREEEKWIRSHSSLCCIGWYAECFQTYDFFPPRFLHILLLRLAFTFALPNNYDKATIIDVYSRKCTLWKNGIQWLLENGVEGVVEISKQKRAVLVMVRGSSDQQVECGDILNKVVAKVVEAKSEFCNSLKAKLYIVSPDDLRQSTIPKAHQLQLFETGNVQKVLLKGSGGAVGRGGKGFLPYSDLICLKTQTTWNKLFLMGIKDLLYHLEDIVMRWYQLGVQLNVPLNKLNEIRCNNPSDVYQCKLLMLQEWQRQPTLKPSWCTLVDALYSMEENVIADRIAQQFNVDLERKLLDPSLASCELGEDTLQQLVGAIGDKWASIALSLSFTTAEIEQIRKEDCPAQSMLQKLKNNGTLKHEQLCSQLRTISLLNPAI